MLTVSVDPYSVADCRSLAACIVGDVQAALRRRSTVGIERAVFRLLGLNAADAYGRPIANRLIELMKARGWLEQGALNLAGRLAVALGDCGTDQAEGLLAGAYDLPDVDETALGKWARDRMDRVRLNWLP